MTEKIFYTKQQELKSEIIEEIANLMQNKLSHTFNEKVYVHYIEGEVATTEVCESIEVKVGETSDQLLFNMFDFTTGFVMDETAILKYDVDSLINIYHHLKKDLIDEHLDEITSIVKDNGGKISTFVERGMIYITIGTCTFLANVNNLSLDSDECLVVNVSIPGKNMDLKWDELDLEEMKSLLYIVKKATEKTWSVKAEAIYSRTFDVKAESWEKACEIVKDMLDKEPFCEDDTNGVQLF
jgi:hypothetical protein